MIGAAPNQPAQQTAADSFPGVRISLWRSPLRSYLVQHTRITMQMTLTQQIAKHLREVHFGGNWTSASLKDKLADVTWQQATTRVRSIHTIATLVYHMNYYVSATVKVLEGGTLDAKDKYSFDGPAIQSDEDWQRLLQKTWTDAEELACLIEQMPESRLWESFVDEKYGNYYRCLHGPIEHCHYHLGQIALIKTMLSGDALTET